MDHFRRYLQGRFARDEDDPSPLPLFHWSDVMTAQPHTAHYIHLEHSVPIIVRNLVEGLWLKNAKVVHKDIDGGKASDRRVRTGLRSQIGRYSVFGSANSDCFFNALQRPAIHDYRYT